jgi:hypothetical protein
VVPNIVRVHIVRELQPRPSVPEQRLLVIVAIQQFVRTGWV